MDESTLQSITNAVLTQIFTFNMNMLRRRIVNSIDPTDICLGKVRELMETQLEQLHNKMDKILIGSIQSANIYIIKAMIHLEGDVNDSTGLAKHYFLQAEIMASSAFGHAINFESKMAATRILILCSCHVNDLFRESCDKSVLGNLLQAIFQQLVESAEVQSALQDPTQDRSLFRSIVDWFSGSSNMAKRFDILTAVVELRSQLVLSVPQKYDIRMKNGRVVDTGSDIAPVSFTFASHIAVRLCIHDELLYVGDNSGRTVVWNTSTMKMVAAIAGPIREGCVRDIMVHASIILISYDAMMEVQGLFNLVTYLVVYDKTSYTALKTIHPADTPRYGYLYMGVLQNKLFVSFECQIIVYDLCSYAQIETDAFDDVTAIDSIRTVFCTRDKLILHSGISIVIYDFISLKVVKRIDCNYSRHRCVAVSNDFICVPGYAGNTLVYSVDTLEVIASLQIQTKPWITRDIRISGHRLYVSMDHNTKDCYTVQCWDLYEFRLVRTIPLTSLAEDFVVLGNRMYAASKDITVYIV